MAEGSGLTNGSTAILAFGYARAGFYRFAEAAIIQGTGYLWSRSVSQGVTEYSNCLYFLDGTLISDTQGNRAVGRSIRKNLSLIFSPEAMGWPRDQI